MRKYGFYYRYDTDAERVVLNRLWKLVNDRFNYLTPTKETDRVRHRRRRSAQTTVRQARHPAGPAVGRRRAVTGTSRRTGRLPRLAEPAKIAREIADLKSCSSNWLKRRPSSLPRLDPLRTARHPQGIRVKAS